MPVLIIILMYSMLFFRSFSLFYALLPSLLHINAIIIIGRKQFDKQMYVWFLFSFVRVCVWNSSLVWDRTYTILGTSETISCLRSIRYRCLVHGKIHVELHLQRLILICLLKKSKCHVRETMNDNSLNEENDNNSNISRELLLSSIPRQRRNNREKNI